MPARPTMKAPVGKSGPLMCYISFSTSASGSSIIATIASTTSGRRCGGMFGRHPDRDPGGAVDEQVREPRRQRQRLPARLVVVRAEVDGVRVDVAQHLRGDARQPSFGVAHGGRRVVVDRAEVALPVDERVAQRERLRHAHERVVDRRVAVWMVVAHHVADDLRALHVRPPRAEPAVPHRPQHPPVHGLEAVADIGQRAARRSPTSRSRG